MGLGVIAMKGYSTFPRSPEKELQNHKSLMLYQGYLPLFSFSFFLFGGVTLCREKKENTTYGVGIEQIHLGPEDSDFRSEIKIIAWSQRIIPQAAPRCLKVAGSGLFGVPEVP